MKGFFRKGIGVHVILIREAPWLALLLWTPSLFMMGVVIWAATR